MNLCIKAGPSSQFRFQTDLKICTLTIELAQKKEGAIVFMDKKVSVSADLTILDLKKMVEKEFAIAIEDQNLSWGSAELADNSQIGTYYFPHNACLTLFQSP